MNEQESLPIGSQWCDADPRMKRGRVVEIVSFVIGGTRDGDVVVKNVEHPVARFVGKKTTVSRRRLLSAFERVGAKDIS